MPRLRADVPHLDHGRFVQLPLDVQKVLKREAVARVLSVGPQLRDRELGNASRRLETACARIHRDEIVDRHRRKVRRTDQLQLASQVPRHIESRVPNLCGVEDPRAGAHRPFC